MLPALLQQNQPPLPPAALIALPILVQAARVSGCALAPISSMQHVCDGVKREPLQEAQPPQFHGAIAATLESALPHCEQTRLEPPLVQLAVQKSLRQAGIRRTV